MRLSKSIGAVVLVPVLACVGCASTNGSSGTSNAIAPSSTPAAAHPLAPVSPEPASASARSAPSGLASAQIGAPPGQNVSAPVLVASSGAVVLSGSALEYSGSGGAAWQKIGDVASIAGGLPAATGGWILASVYFLNATDGWAGFDTAGQTAQVAVSRTTDGGATWTYTQLPTKAFTTTVPTLSQLRFTSPLSGWAVLNTYSSGCVLGNAELLRTSDGGVTWSTVGALPAGCGWVAFVGPKDGWFTREGAVTHGGSGPWMWSTSSGGDTWQPATISPTSCASQAFLSPASAFPPSDQNAVVDAAGNAATVGCGGVLSSSNLGKTWSLHRGPLASSSAQLAAGSPTNWIEVDASAATGDNVATTNDAGKTWHRATIAIGAPNSSSAEGLALSPSGQDAWLTLRLPQAGYTRLFVGTSADASWANRGPGT
jgi:hypothetical protein